MKPILKGTLTMTAIVVIAIPISIVSWFMPLYYWVLPRAVADAVGLATFVMVTGPGVFRPALHPPSAGAWPWIGWLVIAVVFGIATRKLENHLRLFGYAAATVVLWLTLQVLVAQYHISHDWRRANNADLQQTILAETPLGSSMAQVEALARSKGWSSVQVDREHGFPDHRGLRRGLQSVGVMSIRANAGDFQGFPFQSNVTVFWGFDRDGKLIDAWAWRTTDSL